MTNQDIFQNIYLNERWSRTSDTEIALAEKFGFDHVPESGAGSVVAYSQPWINAVNEYIAKNDVQTILDIGSGDFNLSKELNLLGKTYIGLDVAPYIYEKTSAAYTTSNVSFLLSDAVTMDLPAADLIICKDVFIDQDNASVLAILEKVEATAKYALFGDCYLPIIDNPDTEVGVYRPLNLATAPFNKNYTLRETWPSVNSVKSIFVFEKQV